MRNKKGENCLFNAVRSGSVEVMQFISSRMNPYGIQRQNITGDSVFHLAAMFGQRVMLQHLRKNEGKRLDTLMKTNKRKWSPLHYAVFGAHLLVIRQLLKWGRTRVKYRGNEAFDATWSGAIRFLCKGGYPDGHSNRTYRGEKVFVEETRDEGEGKLLYLELEQMRRKMSTRKSTKTEWVIKSEGREQRETKGNNVGLVSLIPMPSQHPIAAHPLLSHRICNIS